MGRKRILIPDGIYHITDRGNNRRNIFASECDYRKFLDIVSETKDKILFRLYHFVLIPNHFHLNIEVGKPAHLPKIMQSICQRYSLYHKRRYGRTGTLWEGPYYCGLIKEESHQLMCGPYIELNPVRAGLVAEPGEWPWSSYRIYAGLETYSLVDIDPFHFPGLDRQSETDEYLRVVSAWSDTKNQAWYEARLADPA